MKRILVIGGTGLVGTPIVRQLGLAGWQVRVMSRKAAALCGKVDAFVELFPGDANRDDDLARAMAGYDAVLVCVSDLLDPYLDLRVTQAVTRLAPAAGVERVGLISGASVAEERRYFPMIDAKYQAEKHLEACGVPWVVVRLTWPMESLVRFVRGNAASILGRQPATIHPIAGADIGRSVERAVALDEALGHTFTLHGPTACTMEGWLTDYCARLHPGMRVKHVPLWMLSAVATLTRDRTLNAVVALMRYFDGLPEFGDPTDANRILGAPELTLEAWVATLPKSLAVAA